MKIRTITFLLFLCVFGNILDAQEVILKKGKYYAGDNRNPFTGVVTEIDSITGNTISEMHLKNGLLHGLTKLFFPSGFKKEYRSYREGKKDGIWSTWNENGTQTALATFLDGKKDGEWSVWDDKGVKRYEMYYKNGKKAGIWLIRDENGKVISREIFK